MRQPLCSRPVSPVARTSRCCSGASATASKMRRWRSRTGSSLFRSIRPSPRSISPGLSRLLRRNPTDAERALWHALTNDRRFAGKGIKRQVPVGVHITDFVSFPLRLVIDLLPGQENESARRARAERRAWLIARGYRVLEVEAGAVAADLAQVLDRLAQQIDGG